MKKNWINSLLGLKPRSQTPQTSQNPPSDSPTTNKFLFGKSYRFCFQDSENWPEFLLEQAEKKDSELDTIDLSGNKFNLVPVWLSKFPKLKKLSFSWNSLKEFDPDLKDRLNELELLDLTENPLHFSLNRKNETGWINSQVLFSFKSLKDLSLGKMPNLVDAEEFDEFLGQFAFPELSILKIHSSNLSGILNLSVQLIQLSEITLSENRIVDISILWLLPKLTKVVAKKNSIMNLFGKHCLNLSNVQSQFLEYLDLRENLMSEFPNLSCFPNLNHVDFGFNKISHLKPILDHAFIPIKMLFVDGNHLTSVDPEWILPFSKTIVRLDLSYNLLFDFEFEKILKISTKMEEIALRGNPVEDQMPKNPPILMTSTPSRDVPSLIEPNLYLGSLLAALNFKILNDLKISHILTVAHDIPPQYPFKFKYLVVRLDDCDQSPLSEHFDECFEFINQAHEKGESVLIHCAAGISRSATITISFVMKKHRLKYEEAHSRVKQKRAIICPNNGFRLQLLELEKKLNL